MAEPIPEHVTARFPAASDPKGIRAALPPEAVTDFDADFKASMATATEAMDLSPVMACLEHWRRVAWMYAADPAAYRKMLDTSERLLSGQEVPLVSGPVSKARIAARIATGR